MSIEKAVGAAEVALAQSLVGPWLTLPGPHYLHRQAASIAVLAARDTIIAERDAYWKAQIDTLCFYVDVQAEPRGGVVQTEYLRRFAARVVDGTIGVGSADATDE